MPKQAFQELFCRRFDCPPSEYEERAFRECLYAHARLLAPLLRKMNAELFKPDLSFLHYLGEATDLREVRANLADFRDTNSRRGGFWRKGLRIRVSGRKAGRLARELFARGLRNKVPGINCL